MDNTKRILKTISGILLAILAIYLGKAFWQYFMLSFGTALNLLIILIWLGYIYIAIFLIKFKKWALKMFLTIFLSAIGIELILLATGESQTNILESIYHLIFYISLVAIPVFGISALIRKIISKVKNKA